MSELRNITCGEPTDQRLVQNCTYFCSGKNNFCMLLKGSWKSSKLGLTSVNCLLKLRKLNWRFLEIEKSLTDIDFNKNLGVVIDHKITWKQHTVYGKQLFKSRNIWKYNIMPTDHSFFPWYFTVSTFKITIYAKVLLLAIHIDHTNPLFINPHAMKFNDLVDCKII